MFDLSAAGPTAPGLGAVCAFRVEPPTDGPLSVLVESLDGDVLVRLLDTSGSTLAEDDNGGVAWNSCLVVEHAAADHPLLLLAAFREVRCGTLSIEVRAGIERRPEGPALESATANFLEARGLRRLERGETETAPSDLLKAGDTYFHIQDSAAANRVFARLALLLTEPDQSELAARVRAMLASTTYRMGQVEEALPMLRESAREMRSAGDAPLELLVISDLAQVSAAQGELSDARDQLARCLELARQGGFRDRELILNCQLSAVCLSAGDADEARRACDSANALAAGLDVPDLRVEALVADAHWNAARGQLQRAAELQVEALALPMNPTRRVNLLGEHGDVLRLLGDLHGAADSCREAGAIATELGDPDLLATTTAGLGMAQRELGDLAAARDSLQAALDAWGDGGNPANRVVVLGELAAICSELGQHEKALELVGRARALAHALGNPAVEMMALEFEGYVHSMREDFAAWESNARSRLALVEGAGEPVHEASALQDLATAMLRLGHVDEAEAAAQKALALIESYGREYDTLNPLFTLAEVALKRRDAGRAAALIDRASAAMADAASSGIDTSNQDDLRTRGLEQTLGRLPLDLAALQLELAGDDAKLQAAAIDAGLRALGEWKGRQLLAGVQGQRLGGGDAQAVRLLSERRSALADRDAAVARLTRAVGESASAEERAPLLVRLHDLDRRVKDLGAQLAQASPREAALETPRPTGLAELRGLLAKGDVYVEYGESIERLYAYVVTQDKAALHDLGPAGDLARQVEAYLAQISRPGSLAPAADVAASGHRLYEVLLATALPSGVPSGARLIIVPSALVAALPFEALVVSAEPVPHDFNSLVFVLDQREVVYAPSGPVLALMAHSGPRGRPGDALVLGDPLYSDGRAADVRGVPQSRLAPERLPGTRDEALDLSSRLLAAEHETEADIKAAMAPARTTDSIALDLPGLRLVLGGAATPGALRGDLGRFALIHCAAHSRVDAQDARLTGLWLAPGTGDDGIVTLGDVLELSLDADLAVLSACETGRGAERTSEGTQSLARAFLYAGARAVVCSLWPVDDHETARTMNAFYDGLLSKNLTASAALREARLAVRRAPAAPGAFLGTGRGKRLSDVKVPAAPGAGHPYFWAAFTYIGPPDLRPLEAPAR